MSKRRGPHSLHDDANRFTNEENNRLIQQHSLPHQEIGTFSPPFLINRGDAPLSYTLLNAGAAAAAAAAPSSSAASHGGAPHAEILTQIYQPEVGAHGDKLSLLLAEGNMMSHSGDHQGNPPVAEAIDKQYYVMLTPNADQSADKRPIAPRTQFSPHAEPSNARQARRRELHNEVERRRRDNINSWMVQLSKILPDCVFGEDNRSKALTATSKGAILEKAVAYIEALKAANTSLGKQVNETQQMKTENEILRRQIEALKAENDIMREQLERNGLQQTDSKFS